ncbi:MAG: hypothetical protein HY060_03855 [Proteobacteria bacterium]|nr:hypothetical protein [Pseudomonadota bacterium]
MTSMGRKLAASLIASVAIVLGWGSLGSAAGAADAAANRKASANYDAVVRGNPAFRNEREHAECDAIESLDLRAQCIASFAGVTVIRPVAPERTLPPDDLMHPRVTITNGPVRNPDDD